MADWVNGNLDPDSTGLTSADTADECGYAFVSGVSLNGTHIGATAAEPYQRNLIYYYNNQIDASCIGGTIANLDMIGTFRAKVPLHYDEASNKCVCPESVIISGGTYEFVTKTPNSDYACLSEATNTDGISCVVNVTTE